MKTTCRVLLALSPAVLAVAGTAHAQPAAQQLSYADIADLTIAAPVIVQATITKVEKVGAKDSPGLAPGKARLLLTGAVTAALVAPGNVPASLQWLSDVPLDARGKAPRPKGEQVLLWLTTPGPEGRTRLIAGAGQQPWSPALDARVRSIATDAKSATVPVFTGVTNGFHVDGTVSGESESQFFLKTKAGNSVTMVMTTRPGIARRVAIARGDVIDESATVVKPETFLRYRLACFLPATLPPGVAGGDAVLAADWRAALATIGPCGRTL